MPVWVPENVPVVAEVKFMDAWTVPDPEASENRPVPPVTVKEPDSVKAFGVLVGQIVS